MKMLKLAHDRLATITPAQLSIADAAAYARTAARVGELHDRVSLLFGDEMRRFTQIINAAGAPDESAAPALLQAAEALEAAR